MTLQELRYFVAVADTGHFARAAERCHVSQPTLSTQLKKLEDYLGVALFDRSLRRVTPTPAGREILRAARAIVAEAERIRVLAHAQGKGGLESLRLGAIATVAPYYLPHALTVLRGSFPRIRLLLREGLTAGLLQALAAGDLDAALVALPVEAEDLEVEPLFDETFVAALPKGHPLAARRTVDPKALTAAGVLLLEEGHCLREQALEICGAAGAASEELMATSLETLAHMVAGGIGCTLLPALAAGPSGVRGAAGLEIRRFKRPVPHRTIGLVWRRRYPHGDTLHDMARCLRQGLPADVSAARSASTISRRPPRSPS
ncbi:MAG: LysR substrate-binding domain-containing protein [Gammaproteobacteria bacterium]